MTRRCLWIFVALTLILASNAVVAQDNTILTFSVPQWMQDAYPDTYFDAFRESHPGVNVIVKGDGNSLAYPTIPAYSSVEENLEKTLEYVSTADVLYASNWTISPESTQAGLWLNLMPLVAADPDLDEANFYPPAWRAFQWNGGMWALPVTLTPQILLYDTNAFDKAGLTYPDANWSLQQYLDAAIKLTPVDDKGRPTQTGCWCNMEVLFYGLLQHGLADADGAPNFDDPQLVELLETWAAAQGQIYPKDGYSSQGVPLLMMEPYVLSSNYPTEGLNYVPGEMPNGVYGATVNAFAVSPGAADPRLAFELVKYLAENPANVNGAFGTFSALRNTEMVARSSFTIQSIDTLPAEQQAILLDAVENAVAGADLMYFTYLYKAVDDMTANQTDAVTALQTVKQQALDNRAAAIAWQGAQNVAVAPVEPTPSFSTEEIVLNFGLSMWGVSNTEAWERVGQEFAQSDPQVGALKINSQGNDYVTWNEQNDCYYLNYDAVTPNYSVSYMPLDPWMDADPDFNTADFMPGALEALQLGETTYGYPLSAEVSALSFTPDQFEKAGVPLPDMNWNINQFIDALNQLAASSDDAAYRVAFSPRLTEDTDWLMLMAAVGALPIDPRTEPPTVNFNDPATVEGIRQVLDLAKSGLIDYQKLGTFNYGGMPKIGALTAVSLSGMNFSQSPNSTQFINFPQGTAHGVMALGSVHGGYIRGDTQYGDACYRWIATIARHPELLAGVMPATRSGLDNPVTATVQGEAIVDLYRQYFDLAADPTTIKIPSAFGGTLETYFMHQFLDRAFDAYVLNGADLEEALTEAGTDASQFSECFKSVADVNESSSEAELIAYNDGIQDCLTQVDPDMAAERQAMMPSS